MRRMMTKNLKISLKDLILLWLALGVARDRMAWRPAHLLVKLHQLTV